MQIVAALADKREINKIMQSFGIPAPEPPLKIQTKDDQFSEIIDPTFDEF